MLSRQINILLVEETLEDPEPILGELERAGFSPHWQRAENWQDYLGRISRPAEAIDLIFVDQAMAGFSIPDALCALKSKQEDIPLIILGTPINGEAIDYIRMGASDYIIKDGLSRLGLTVTRILSENQLRKDLTRANIQLLSTYDHILHAWAQALEMRDFETLEHTRRVTTLSLKLARFMGLDGETLTHMSRGALLHDIGKLGIPDKILLKPDPLTPEERALMQQHPVFAYMMLSPIEFLKQALDIPIAHHEKWDGTGYPYGLVGEKIPLVARIFAIVDVWDALNSSRPYRADPWPKEKILQHLQQESGKHFDPAVVQAFMMLMNTNGNFTGH